MVRAPTFILRHALNTLIHLMNSISTKLFIVTTFYLIIGIRNFHLICPHIRFPHQRRHSSRPHCFVAHISFILFRFNLISRCIQWLLCRNFSIQFRAIHSDARTVRVSRGQSFLLSMSTQPAFIVGLSPKSPLKFSFARGRPLQQLVFVHPFKCLQTYRLTVVSGVLLLHSK